MKGGLKEIETQLGIRRPSDIEELTGYDATVLWAKYLRGDKRALDQLVQYNTEDVVHLKAIMEINYQKLADILAASGLDGLECAGNARPQLSRAAG